LEEIRDNHSEVVTTPAILTILHSQGFFHDMQHLSKVLLPIKNAILAVEATNSTLADAYIYLIKSYISPDDFCLKVVLGWLFD